MSEQTKFKGIPIVSGRGIGKACFPGRPLRVTPMQAISKKNIENQISLFHQLREAAKHYYSHHIRQMVEINPDIQEFSVLNIYKQLLDDPIFISEVVGLVSRLRIDIETAIRTVADDFIIRFDAAQTAYFRERSGDMVEVREKLISLIPNSKPPELPASCIILIVPGVLTPSDFLKFDKSAVKGIVALNAGPTSHAAILARTYGIPVVSGIQNLKELIHSDDEVLVNGYEGSVYINPDITLIRSLRADQALNKKIKILSDKHAFPVSTTDGVPVSVLANVALPDDVDLARRYGADGIGLVRSEFLYFMHTHLPTALEQQHYFENLFKRAKGKELIIRLFDLGGDKRPPQLELPKEINPFIGSRGIRILLKRKEFFVEHLSAIMKAAHGRQYAIMIPMVTTLNEWKEAKAIIDNTAQQSGLSSPPCGILLEVPLAILEADRFLPHVDFMSLGTNDLIQYLSAVDRGNTNVAHLYNPIEPAFLRILRKTIQATQDGGKTISICGEMGGIPLYTILLLGLGLKRFSMVPRNIPIIKSILSRISSQTASAMTQEILINCSPLDMTKQIVLLNKKVLGSAYREFESFFNWI
ncbi:MAG: phosphoenolpyruvate--protein phosphotransferase [Elusimicrobia bacterium RIFOXYB2_FULL_49_7]|nr:MAG: phosphoenolpyruvate--protein phosphotransferase [Elusimicrobia bacterium RIFOXYB2_FULL_49_7]